MTDRLIRTGTATINTLRQRSGLPPVDRRPGPAVVTKAADAARPAPAERPTTEPEAKGV